MNTCDVFGIRKAMCFNIPLIDSLAIAIPMNKPIETLARELLIHYSINGIVYQAIILCTEDNVDVWSRQELDIDRQPI